MLDVELPSDHPGFADPEYRARRAQVATAAEEWLPGQAIPVIAYTEVEHGVWATVCRTIAPLHRELAVAEYSDAAAALDLPTDRVPQLSEVSARLQQLSATTVRPVAGLLPGRMFFEALATRQFPSTQYVRHPSVPLYTPEPDVIHELVGHAAFLAHRDMADLYELAGAAALRCTTPEAMDVFGRVFWFTLEFGVAWERGELRAYGSGLLSSAGEMEAFRKADVHPFDLAAMGAQQYDYASFQPKLFAAESFGAACDALFGLFSTFDDEQAESLRRP